MEADEEDAPNVNGPSLQPQQDDAVPLHRDTQEELKNTEQQCESESVPEPELEDEPERLGLGVGGESEPVAGAGGERGDGDGIEGECKEGGTDMEHVAEVVVEETAASALGEKSVVVVDETALTGVAEDLGAEMAMETSGADAAEGTTVVVDLAEKLVGEEEGNVAEGDVALETEVGDVDDKALETEEKVLAEAAVVAHLVQKEEETGVVAEESNVADIAEETVVSWKEKTAEAEAEGDEAEAERDEAEAESVEAEAERDYAGVEEDKAELVGKKAEEVGEEAEEEGEETEAMGGEAEEEKEEAEAEGHEENVVDMVSETIETEATEEADDVMEENTEAEEAEETEAAEEEADEMEVVEETSRDGAGGKRKRGGKNSKISGKVLSKKKMEEDVCFICFDGGELVLCDRRGCPKAYHPSCVNRDEAFFQSKGRWNCGWHICSNCEKNAYYMCYTCTFSLCKGCIKDAAILCVRGNKGFCDTCMKTVMLIEKNEQGNKDLVEVDFDDKSSWEYLFKDYWIDLKEKLSLTLDELAQAKNPWKGSAAHAYKQESRDEPYDVNNDGGSDSDNSENLDVTNSKRRKGKKRLRTRGKVKDSPSPATATGSEGASADDITGWASQELLEFVMHMRNGDKSALSQFDVQALLLEYIKRNKLRDPRRKSQIICDSRLQNLFGKPRVGHFEMLKLLESHFLIKEDAQTDDLQGSVVDTEGSQLEADGNTDALAKSNKDKRRKTRKKGDGRGPQSNIDDFAAIDIHNINLIYLRRNLVEDLLENMENFQEKVVGSFVRIRISGSNQKQDLYRLVQVIGTCKAAEPYKVGKRTTDILLEILNLNKTEIVSIDIISNQEFTEDECKRLRQSIKCGLINRLTVGDVQEKAMALQEVRVKDWLETEIVRLSHLRDRASEKGRRKELRECVEKLQTLKTPEERLRRLEETVEIHADPNMDPSYESEEDEDEGDDKKQESYMRPTGSGFGRKGREPISPRRGGSSLNDSWSGSRNNSNMNRELSRNMSNKGFFNKAENTTGAGEIVNDLWGQGRDRETQQTNHWEKNQNISSLETGVRSTQTVVLSESSPAQGSENSVEPLSSGVAQSAANINETEKIWHYQDPSGKVQGPFSMVQLRKWNNTGYFPANLRVWRNTEKQEDSILVTDALAGKFQKDPSLMDSSFPKSQMVHDSHLSPANSGKAAGALLHRGAEGQAGGGSWGSQSEINSSTGRSTPSSVEVPKYSADGWGTTNFPSPTPSRTPMGGAQGQGYENNWSPTPLHPAGSVSGANSLPGGNGMLQPPAVVTPESAMRVSGNDRSSSLPGMTAVGTTNARQIHGQGLSPVLTDASMNSVADVKNIVSNLQNLVQSVTGRSPVGDPRGWGSGSVPKQEITASGPVPGSESQPWGGAPSQNSEPNNGTTVPVQHPGHGYWGNAPSTNNATPSINTGNSAGNFQTTGFSGVPHSDPWRPPLPSNQSYVQPPPPAQVPWGMGVADNQSAVRTGQENQNTSWVPMAGNPNMAWGGPVAGNANMNFGAPGQGSGWTAPGQGPVPGNVVPNWVPPGQGPPSVSANPGWVAPGQGPVHGNANPGWGGAPTANPVMRGSEQTQNGDRFANQRDRGSHGADSGFGAGKPWNRQSTYGGGGGGASSRPPFKGQRVCKFYESGHCKKGASCDYLHPDH